MDGKTQVKLASRKWVMSILKELQHSKRIRFNLLKSNLGSITSTTLSDLLKELMDSGIVKRKVYREVPSHVEYWLTEDGKIFYRKFKDLFDSAK